MMIASLRRSVARRGVSAALGVLAALGLALTGACGGALGKSYPPYRYRLTVEIDTPEGLRRGSSVIEVRTSVAGPYTIPNPGHVFTRIKGQAVAVDLPNGQTLFALLRSDWESQWADHVFARLVPRPSQEEVKARSPDGKWNGDLDFDLSMERILALRGPQTVPRRWSLMGKDVSNWPMFVRFRDIRDPASVERVDPDDLKAAFGKGYGVRRIIAERTEDEVTHKSQVQFPWSNSYRERMLDGASINNSTEIANNLSLNDFVRGE